jgi:site-specific recombinase XerD
MKALVAEFGHQPAEQITAGDIRRWLNSKAPEWTLATRNRYCALLKMTYRIAEEDGLVKINPARLVRQQKENNGCIRYITDAEESLLRAVMAKFYGEHICELEIALMTGMRQGEQFSLTWDKVDLDASVIRLEDTKNGAGRFVRLNTCALAVLASLRDRDLGTGRVFVLNKVPRWFTDAAKAAGLKDVTCHTLRHTFISRLMMAGVDVRTVMDLAGHKSISMTMRYTHLAPGHSAKALEKLCESTATSTATEAEETENPVALTMQ